MVKPEHTTPSNIRKPDEEPPFEKSIMKPDEPEEDNSYEKMVYGRLNIGARNPIVLAINKLESMDYTVPPGPYSGEDIRKLLEKAYGESAYEKLFDPASGSPVYYGIYEATARLADCLAGAQPYGEMLGMLSMDPARRIGPGVIHPDCPNRVISANQSGIIDGVPVQYRDLTSNLNGGIEFNDPVQGCVADCWLLAALSSVAFIEWKEKKQYISRAPPITVYPLSIWPKSCNINASDEYFTTQNTQGKTIPYYGGLNPRKPIPPANIYESWVCYYEKCFAGLYQNVQCPGFQIINPVYNQLNYRGTFRALSEITGKIVSTATQGKTMDYLGGAGVPDRDGDLIEKIRISACNSLPLNEGVVLYTRKPAIAYTYLSKNYVPAAANVAGKVPPYSPATVEYNCVGMPANHAFSILGLYKKNNIKYVVLRNPWGCAGDAASFNAGLQASLAPGLVLPAPYDTLNLGLEGIFGISSVNFMRYFEAFGWTALF